MSSQGAGALAVRFRLKLHEKQGWLQELVFKNSHRDRERESTNKQNLGTGWNKSGGFSCLSLAAGRWNRNQTTLCLCVFWVGDASCFNHNLTRQTVQLSSERGHDQVVLHDVRHLVLHVLLIECDQGI